MWYCSAEDVLAQMSTAYSRLRKRGDVRRVDDGGLEISHAGVENSDRVGESSESLHIGLHVLLDARLVPGWWHDVDDRRSCRTGRRKPFVSR